ncbi:Adenylate cyclase [Pseudohaliea rubra DSM 19751]|uniref:Adenylate cyclase n=2 Tax=Pseudohaliea TaxID=1341120 RepID=A0A095XSX7_9GAMM|nr:Adenylate cyclase [Pseudohaliea rubra DSM 19751]
MGKKHEEVEFKAGVDPATLARLRRHRSLRPATVGRASTRRLVSIYYDAGDLRLMEAGLFLRMRRSGGRWEQTIKAARLALPGLQRVTEVTDPADGPEPSLTRISQRAVHRALEAALAGAALQPVCRSDIQRTTRLLETGEGRVELAFDRGSVSAGDVVDPFCEVEIECIDGGARPAWSWAQTLLDGEPVRLVQPSKAARGFTLAAGGEPLRAAVNHSNPSALGPQRTSEAAVEAMLAQLAHSIAENLYIVFTRDDPEGPHQLRVALRRLRALLRTTDGLLRKGGCDGMARRARDLGRLLAPLRDADVLTALLLEAGHDDELDAALCARRDAVRAEVREALREASATGFAITLLRLVDEGGWNPHGKSRRKRLRQPLAGALGPALDAQWSRVKRHGKGFGRLDAAARHRLRKDLKVLRYMLEIAALDPKAPPPDGLLKTLGRLQDALGVLNDADNLAGQRLTLDDPALARALARRQARLPVLKKTARRKQLAKARRAWGRLQERWHR